MSAFFSMFVFGLSDAAPGALLPYLERYYDLSYVVVSLIFLVQFIGYTIAAFTNASIHNSLGQRGVALITPMCHIITYVVYACHAPWPCMVVFAALCGFGNGLIDGAWSAWAGNMHAGNVLAGSLHAFYALGSTFSPLIATSLVAQRHVPWWYYYYMMVGLSGIELLVCSAAFWSKDGARYRREHPKDPGQSQTREALKNKVTWLCSVFFLIYVGAEVSLGGWIVSFMLNVRKASAYTSGITATGFWAGMTVGRSGLGVVTHALIKYTNTPGRSLSKLRLTERSIVSVYLLITIALQLLFWLVPSITASAIAVALLGMFMGPIFPSGIIMATKLLPARLHITSIGFSTALGGTGAAVFPFAVGAIAQARGVKVLQPIILALLVVLIAVWWAFPRLHKERRDE